MLENGAVHTNGHCQRSSFNEEDIQFLSSSHSSREKFLKEYKKLYSSKEKAEQLYLLLLTELEAAITEGNVDRLKNYSNFIDYITDAEDQATLREYYDHVNNPVRYTNLVILACKHNKVTILKHLLGSNGKIVNNLSVGVGDPALSPDDEDDTCHNAFYYAIRSGNAELLEALINKWPGNYFVDHLGELDEILSLAYEELKLKNVPLSEEMELFVENKLISLRFFSNVSGQHQNAKSYLSNIRERIELVLQNISLLMAEYSNTEKVDGKFLFVAKFIAQNIHILKRQLRSTYERLPWEEMEFCLVSFVSSHMKRQEINLFYNATLNKDKILNHLNNFAKELKVEQDTIEGLAIGRFTDLPKLKRERVVAEIVRYRPQFEELYSDYQQIRDIHTLEKISDYIKLALSADPKQREGQLLITRVLQVIGEYLKNTLESPKLSSTTSELLLLSLPRNTREVIIDLRNSLSHAYSLDNTDVSFFKGVQKDTQRIDDVINGILYNNKMKIIKVLLKKITTSESLDEIREIAELFTNVKFDAMLTETFKVIEDDKLEKLIKELSDNITDKDSYEKELFNEIHKIINSAETKSKNMRSDYVKAFVPLKAICIGLNDDAIDHNTFIAIKKSVQRTLESIPCQIDSHNLKEVVDLAMKIVQSATLRMGLKDLGEDETCDRIHRLSCEIFLIAELKIDNFKCIEELRDKLNKGMVIPTYKQRKPYNMTEENYNNQLELKISELKSILRNNALGGELTGKLPSYRSNKKLQAVVEMLVLDIMSILGSSEKHLENNLLFLDDNTPLLIGKGLRNHLAHDNTLVEVLLSDPSIAVILNAKKLVSENVIKSNKKIGKSVRDDPSKLREKYDLNLITITNQEEFFAAIEEGNIEAIKSYIRKGADIYARNIHLSTPLHIAAQGTNLEVLQFIIKQKIDVNIKDENGQSPLHIASAHGRKTVVEFLLRQTGVNINELDNSSRTALHIAAKNGHRNVVEILLKSKAQTDIKENGFSPLHYAMQNNHVDVAKILLEKEANVDIDETHGGFTSLHIVAEKGYLELVNLLLESKANVHARNDRGGTPLHTAALNGHLEVVNALILKGADVNARFVDGFTPLLYAIENGHEKIVDILLQHGADVNAAEKTSNTTPLHHAAKYGHVNIIKALLANKANDRLVSVEGFTPLHLAASYGHLEIVQVLFAHGANIRVRNMNNATPLYYAAEGGHKTVAEVLIENGAEINDKADENQTPLHAAASRGHKEMIELLLRNKADVRARDIHGNTPLHAAARDASKDVIELLIRHNAEVDARSKDGTTPLYVAALNGNKDAVDFLLKSKATVDASAKNGPTPLIAAVIGRHRDIVNLLIENKANINFIAYPGSTALFQAVERGFKEIVEILIANKANVNVENKQVTPLLSAIMHNHKDIVEILIQNGANVNVKDGAPLSVAVMAGYKDIVEVLLKNKASIKMVDSSLLHMASTRGYKEIVNALLAKGANVNAISADDKFTALHTVAAKGDKYITEILIANGANVNAKSDQGTPLHLAAVFGHANVVDVLVSNGAKVHVKDIKNRTPLEIAISFGHIEVMKLLLRYEKDLNAKGGGDYTLLHIAAQEKKLEITKSLVSEGCDINVKNSFGSKPIHIAAREGSKGIVKFFLSKGMKVDEPGAANQTVLFYAAMKGHIKIVKYLIALGADVNSVDTNGLTATHITANLGQKNVLEVLLQNGAIYNSVDNLGRKPIEITNKDKDVIHLLAATQVLFDFVKQNNAIEVRKVIEVGAAVNARNVELNSGTALHYAAWKGFYGVAKILLENKANPNAVGSKRVTPLHYAAKFAHLKIVKALLSHGAVYDAVSDSGKTPSDFTEDRDVTNLFKLIDDSFKRVKEGNVRVVNDLNKLKDVETVKAVMSARNRDNETLVVAAIHSKFSKVKQLKDILQGDLSAIIDAAMLLAAHGNYTDALTTLRSAFEKRKSVLGPDNPGTLDIQYNIGQVLYKQGLYQEASNILEEVLQKQKEILGLDDKDTLNTRSTIALILHRQGKDEKALNIFEEVYQKQKEIIGENHQDTINTHFHMAIVLQSQGKYDEALNINREIYEKRKEILGLNDITTVCVKNNIAMILSNQGKFEESLKMYAEVLEKKRLLLGHNHTDTLRTLHNIGAIFSQQNKHQEALKAFQDVYNLQKKSLQHNHPETLNSLVSIGNVLYAQGKWINALKVYSEAIDQIRAVFGPSHMLVVGVLQKIAMINYRLSIEGINAAEILHLQTDINVAANDGDVQAVRRLLENGADANDADIDGRTPLHFAVSSGRSAIVNVLLKHGADVTKVTNKGNTPLHTATSKCDTAMVEVLLKHVGRDKLNDFVNAKTTSSGTTSLHVAAKGGSLKIVKCLLKNGATYNVKNKEGKTPVDLSRDQKVSDLLKLIAELFRDIKNNNVESINKLKAINNDELVAVTNARDSQGKTLMQIALGNKQKNFATKLLELLKKSEQK